MEFASPIPLCFNFDGDLSLFARRDWFLWLRNRCTPSPGSDFNDFKVRIALVFYHKIMNDINSFQYSTKIV